MDTKGRRERDKQKQRELILQAASDIFTQEGLEKLSIRKIARKIDYSPGIIYHYFKDKEDIVNQLVAFGFQKMMSSILSVPVSNDSPEKRLAELLKRYIRAALSMPEEYLTVQLSKSPTLQVYTAFLEKGATTRNPALNVLAECLYEIYREKNLEDDEIEITAQVIAASSFGLIMKLINEKSLSEQQKDKIILRYIQLTINGTLHVGNF